MTFRDIRREDYWNVKRNQPNFVLSTDFCLADRHKNTITQPELNLPKSYMFNRVPNPDEFMLGENLNRSRRRYDQIPTRPTNRRLTKVQQQGAMRRKSRIYSKITNVDDKNKMLKIKQEILSKEDFDEADFQESALLDYSSSASTMYDHAIRPFFDESGFFPYDPIISSSNLMVIRTSRLSFRTEFLDFPIQTIGKMSVFLALVRGDQCVSNIVEVEMKLSKPGVWKPSTFHEFDWVVESNAEVSLYAEVVAFIRIPSERNPFLLKSSLIAENSIKFVDYRKGIFQSIKENKHHVYLNRKGEMSPEGQEALLSFYVSHSQVKYSYLPENFICPTSVIPIFERLRSIVFNRLDPFLGNFSLWNPHLLEPIIFADISASEKALFMLCNAWVVQTDKSLLENIKRIYPSTKVMSKTGPFCLLENADSVDKAISRVAVGMVNWKVPNDEKYEPFHTDELRGGRFSLSIPAFF